MKLAAALVVLLAPALARAEPPGLTPPEPPEPHAPPARTYSGQILAVDLTGFGLALSPVGPLPLLGAGTYALGGPLVHLAHHHPGRAAISLLLHVGLPVAGAYLGSSLAPSSEDEGDLAFIALGLLAGAATATTLDAAVLARPSEQDDTPAWSPNVSASSRGVTLGVAGAF